MTILANMTDSQRAEFSAASFRPLSMPHGEIRGNSVAAGSGASRASNGWAQKLLKTLGIPCPVNAGYPGAVMCHSTGGGVGDGGWAFILNTRYPNNYFIGSNQIQNTAPNNLQKWKPKKSFVALDPLQNDIGWLGANIRPGVEAVRTIISGYNAVRTYHCIDLSNGLLPTTVFTRTGTWTNSSYGFAQALGSGCKETSVVGDTMSFPLEPDMPAGSVLAIGHTVFSADKYTYTVSRTRNGTTTVVQTNTVDGSLMCDPASASANGIVFRSGVTGDGINWQAGDVWLVTITSFTAGKARFNYMHVEADPLEAPVIAMALPTRLPDTGYAYYAIAFSGSQGAAMNDAIMDAAAVALKLLANEFSNLIALDFSSVVNTARWPAGSFAYSDGTLASGPLAGLPVQIHPNDDSYSQRAEIAVKQVLASGLITPRRATAFNGPTAPFPKSLGGQAAWTASALLGTGLLNGASQYVSSSAAVPTYPGYYQDAGGMIRYVGKIRPAASGLPFAQVSEMGSVARQIDILVSAGTDDKWTVTVDATGGTFKLTVGGQTTASIAYNATLGTVATALAALTTVKAASNLSLSGTLAAGLAISFVDELAGTPQTLTADSSTLTGNTATAGLVHTTTGSISVATLRVTRTQSALNGNFNSLIAYYSGTVSWISLDGLQYMAEG